MMHTRNINSAARRSGLSPSARGANRAAFTMIEVALSLGILAFALVAIIGVLPSGMKVQKENREQTIINQDAQYLLEAIRSGSKGVDDLTNYVESITVKRGAQTTIYTNNLYYPGSYVPLTNAQHIVSLLSTPKYEWLPDGTLRQNTVTARMRAISGNALDKGVGMQDFAFRYQMTFEVSPFATTTLTNTALLSPPLVTRLANLGGEPLRALNISRGLYDVRLTARWPLFQTGTTWAVGRYRRTIRTLVSGQLTATYTNALPYSYLFQPDTFTSVY